MELQAYTLSRAFTDAAECPESVLASPPALIEMLPLGIYACNASGRLCWYNSKAAEIWGRVPNLGHDTERFCGSYKLFGMDGALICTKSPRWRRSCALANRSRKAK